MIHPHSSTRSQRVSWVSQLLASEGTYRVVSQMRRRNGVLQTLYSWKAKGQSGLEGVFEPRKPQQESAHQLERAVLTLLLEDHASYCEVQMYLESL